MYDGILINDIWLNYRAISEKEVQILIGDNMEMEQWEMQIKREYKKTQVLHSTKTIKINANLLL